MRFEKQELFSNIGKTGQKLLAKASVAIIGCGALGSVSAELLARAGIKRLILIDRDFVEESNLQRQSLYTEKDVGNLKALTLAAHLKEINGKLKIESFPVDLDAENIGLIKADLVLDGTDNFYTRFLINDFCKKKDIPWIFASAVGSSGFVFPVIPKQTCFRCIFNEPSTVLGSCDTQGILNSTVHAITSMQVTEAFKILTKQVPSKELLFFNSWEPSFLKIKVSKNSSCPSCNGDFEFLEGKKRQSIIKMCGSNLFQIKGKELDLKELGKRLSKVGKVKLGTHCLFFKELVIFKEGRVLISAKSEKQAKGLYERYLK